MKIFIAFEAEYSAKRVIGVFDSRGALDAFSGARTRVFSVEEHELNATGGKKVQQFWACHINLGTGEVEAYQPDRPQYALKPIGVGCTVSGPYGGRDPYLEIWSPVSMGHAIKVATEKRQAYLRAWASGLRGDDLDAAIGVTEDD